MSLLSASESFVNCWTGHLFALCSTCLGLTVWDRGTFATRGRDLMGTSQRTVFWLNMVSCVKVDSCYLQQKTGFLNLTRILRYLATEMPWKTKLWREKLWTDRVCLFSIHCSFFLISHSAQNLIAISPFVVIQTRSARKASACSYDCSAFIHILYPTKKSRSTSITKICGTNQYQMFSWFDHRISLRRSDLSFFVFCFFCFLLY